MKRTEAVNQIWKTLNRNTDSIVFILGFIGLNNMMIIPFKCGDLFNDSNVDPSLMPMEDEFPDCLKCPVFRDQMMEKIPQRPQKLTLFDVWSRDILKYPTNRTSSRPLSDN